MGLESRDILSIEEMRRKDIETILDTADSMKEIIYRPIKKVPTLRGKSVVTLFYEASTRTRTSFELAAKYMSADTVSIAAATSSIQKGETLKDTARTLQVMGIDCAVMRHPVSGSSRFLAKVLDIPVVNAGDGMHEHPTQALLDMFTMREKKGRLDGLRVAIVGDIFHSRVARSNIWGLGKMGAHVSVCGPGTLLPPEIERMGVTSTLRVEEAIEGADVVMVLRLQLERQQRGLFPSGREYARLWGITKQRLSLAKPDALLMHPGPVNRGIELSTEVADCPQSTIEQQVTSGVAIRMAILYLLLGGGDRE